MNKRIRFIDLFCGIGGFRIALEQNLFWKCVMSSEIDKNCCDVYERNFGDRPLGDIHKIVNIPDHDVLCGGFPCQPFSMAGSVTGGRKGFCDDRGQLIFEIIRILKNKKPRAFILENVKGLANHDSTTTINTILSLLGKNKYNKLYIKGLRNYDDSAGYFVKYKILDSANFGLAQERKRIFFVGFVNEKDFKEFNWPLGKKSPLVVRDILDKKIGKNKLINISTITRSNSRKKCGMKTFSGFDPIYSKVIDINKKCPTLLANCGSALGLFTSLIPIDNNNVRLFSINELKKLHGFPVNFKCNDNKFTYKQFGNTVSPPVIEAIGKIINDILIKRK